ncbi:MAG: FtsW/RodA/SpoVE family cell cycle protein [Phycisphaerales bacterium]|nr:FtsW/RodA/SpoVE family cell cycle protein [Phycisphaerales bacterium]
MTRVAAAPRQPTLVGAVAPRELRSTLRAGVVPNVRFHRPELWMILGSVLSLAALGIYSISISSGFNVRGLSGLALRQVVYVSVGVGAMAAVAIPHYRRFGPLAWPALGAAIALLVFLLVPFVPSSIVTPRNGARAWIDLGPISLQPAEFAKIAYILALARYLRFRKNYRHFTGFIPPAIITFVPVALIILQPDLGSALLFIPALFAVLVAAGAKIRHIASVVILGLVLAPLAYPFLLPHQKERINAMVRQVQGDTSKADTTQYQSLKAITLVGAGGVAGLGAEHARAVIDFNDLPEQHNDMIFAVISNRFGLAGGLATLGLYLTFIAGGLLAAARCKDSFGRLVAVGVIAFIASQAVINIGVVLGLVPVVGITLPFVSYGGSSMLACCIGAGLLLNIAMRPPERLYRHSFEFGDADD